MNAVAHTDSTTRHANGDAGYYASLGAAREAAEQMRLFIAQLLAHFPPPPQRTMEVGA